MNKFSINILKTIKNHEYELFPLKFANLLHSIRGIAWMTIENLYFLREAITVSSYILLPKDGLRYVHNVGWSQTNTTKGLNDVSSYTNIMEIKSCDWENRHIANTAIQKEYRHKITSYHWESVTEFYTPRNIFLPSESDSDSVSLESKSIDWQGSPFSLFSPVGVDIYYTH